MSEVWSWPVILTPLDSVSGCFALSTVQKYEQKKPYQTHWSDRDYRGTEKGLSGDWLLHLGEHFRCHKYLALLCV